MLGLPVHLPLILIVLATFVGVLTTALWIVLSQQIRPDETGIGL